MTQPEIELLRETLNLITETTMAVVSLYKTTKVDQPEVKAVMNQTLKGLADVTHELHLFLHLAKD